ncbi:unnamed protein product, partial [Rotaria sp. Silwood2]
MLTNGNSPYRQKLAQVMHTRLNNQNQLQQLIEVGIISTRSRWKKTIEDTTLDFPELDLDDLDLLFLSAYKIKQAQMYVEGHLVEAG